MRALLLDPRHYQLGALCLLLAYGVFALDFDVPPAQVPVILGSVLLFQLLFSLWKKVPFDPRSGLISGLSLCILFRAGHWWIWVLAAFLSIAGKFLLRVKGKHVLNPTNGGIVLSLLLCSEAWISPGQWGSFAFFAFLIICLGMLVVMRAGRADITIAFLVFYGGLLFARSLYLSEPMTIPLHRLENGALLLFSFFMISDPKTTPDDRSMRIAFALLVALGASVWQFVWFKPAGIIWSLFFFSFFVPVLDRIRAARKYEWSDRLPAAV